MSKYTLVPIDTIINRVYRDYKPLDPVEPTDIIEWAGEALFKLNAKRMLIEDIAFVKVENYRAPLPQGLCEIIQVAYSNQPRVTKQCLTDTCDCAESDNADDCNYCTETDPTKIYYECWQKDINYYLPEKRYLEIIHAYEVYKKFTPYFYNNYVPMRLSTSTFGAMLKYQAEDSLNLYSSSQYEYKVENNTIYTNVSDGEIVIAYTKQPLDDRGYPLILDVEEVQEAIVKYVGMKMFMPKLFSMNQGAANIYDKLETDWHWYARQCKNKMLIPESLDEKQNHADIGRRLIKPFQSYFGYFGNLNIQEQFNLDGRKRVYY